MQESNNKITLHSGSGSGATVVISHRIREGQQAGYENWLTEIIPQCKSYIGHLDTHIIRPITDLTATYTVVIRFDTHKHAEKWMFSQDRQQLINKVQPLLAANDDFFVRSGLDFWFTPEGAKARLPTRWKQFLITWSVIYPLVLCVPMAVVPMMRLLGMPEYHSLTTLFVTFTIVLLMVYLIMPRYTKLVQRWLFR